MKNLTLALLLATSLSFGAEGLYAKTLYVNNSGTPSCSDSTTYADNTSLAPWCTVKRAAWGSTTRSSPNTSEAAQAGDTVLITSGVYSVSDVYDDRSVAFYNPANSGSSGSPITFRGSGGLVELRAANAIGAAIGCNQKNYIVWDGFYIDENLWRSTGDTGNVVFWNCNNGQILNSQIKGRGTIGREDNYPGVRLEYTDNITVKNNKIWNWGPVDGHNSAGVMTYRSGSTLVENNEIYDCGAGIYFKANTWDNNPTGDGHGLVWNTVNKNYIHDINGDGVLWYRTHQTTDRQKNTQNIFENMDTGVSISPFGDAESDPNNVDVVNNTFINCTGVSVATQLTDPTGNRIYNNIFYTTTASLSPIRVQWSDATYGALVKSQNDAEHNLYYGATNHVTGESISAVSFATWKSTYFQDSASPAGVNSDPLFVGSGSYKLQAGSPALTLGRTITDIHGSSGETIPAGAYITGSEQIGIETSTSTSSRKLNNVTGVRVTLH